METYCIIVRVGLTDIVYGPASYDDAIKFGMHLLNGGSSVTMQLMHPINLEETS